MKSPLSSKLEYRKKRAEAERQTQEDCDALRDALTAKWYAEHDIWLSAALSCKSHTIPAKAVQIASLAASCELHPDLSIPCRRELADGERQQIKQLERELQAKSELEKV